MSALDMLQTFVRKGVGENDLGYLCKWLMVDYRNISLIEYIAKINSYLEDDFFDSPRRIKAVVDHFQESIEREISSIES